MVFRVCVFGFVIIFLGTPVSASSNCTETEACEAVFSPEAMEIYCCPGMDDFQEIIAKCKKSCHTDDVTCTVMVCVAEAYGILTDNKIDDTKVRKVNKALTEKDPASKAIYDAENKNCLNGQYKKYVSSGEECDVKKYIVCAFVNELMGCPKFRKSPCSCKTLAENAKTCKPFLQQYLKQINSN